MKNNSFYNKVDLILWTFISLLPLIGYLIYTNSNVDPVSLGQYLVSMFDFNFVEGNMLYDSFVQILTLVPFLNYTSAINSSIMIYLFYFVVVNLFHLFVDALLFIPRFAHDFLGGLYHEKN